MSTITVRALRAAVVVPLLAASALMASVGHPTGRWWVRISLPPLLIQVGSHEVLLDDAVRLAANAGRDDVEVRLQVAPEGTHVFQFHFGALDEADEAIDEVARFFQRHLS